MSFSIRPITGDEWQLLKEFRLKALLTDPDSYGPIYNEEVDMTDEEWRDWIHSHDRAIFVLLEDSAVVGMTGVVIGKNDSQKKHAIIWGSWFEPHIRRNGMTGKLLERMIDWVRLHHPATEKLLASHRASNTEARLAAEAHGLTPTHRVEKLWADGATEAEHHYEIPVHHLAELSL